MYPKNKDQSLILSS